MYVQYHVINSSFSIHQTQKCHVLFCRTLSYDRDYLLLRLTEYVALYCPYLAEL